MICAYHPSMTEMLTEVKRQFLVWSHCICDLHLNQNLNFWSKKIKKKIKGDQGQNLFYPNSQVLPLKACRALQFTVSLFTVKMKIGAWSIYIWTKRREADYECSKCNFYYTSIILLLITDSFSPYASSKTWLYTIHVHTSGVMKRGGTQKCFIYVRYISLQKMKNSQSICFNNNSKIIN